MTGDLLASPLLDPRTLARMKGLALRSRRVVDGVFQGIHRSPHKGSSIEFAEHKEYTPGDEVRHIDWKAFGRVDKYYVKRFEQESNLRAFQVVDTSASMGYGREGGLCKLDYAAVLAVSLSYLLLRQQDAVGLITFGDEVVNTLPPRARTGHLAHVCNRLEQVEARGGTSLDVGVRRVLELSAKRGIVLLFSDFFGAYDELFRRLRQLVSRGHEVRVFHVLDPDELDFPFEQMTFFHGMETKRKLLVEPRLVRGAYLERMAAHREAIRSGCLEARVGYSLVDTSEPPDRVLLRFLTGREQGESGDPAGPAEPRVAPAPEEA